MFDPEANLQAAERGTGLDAILRELRREPRLLASLFFHYPTTPQRLSPRPPRLRVSICKSTFGGLNNPQSSWARVSLSLPVATMWRTEEASV